MGGLALGCSLHGIYLQLFLECATPVLLISTLEREKERGQEGEKNLLPI